MALADLEVLEPLALSRRHTVVLVDDDPAVLASLRRLFRREPYDILSTTRPDLALRWIENGDVSLVVVDQRMPGMCGTDLALRVRERSPGTIRVMLTAFPGNTIVQHGLAREIQWLISKPWNDDALRLTIRQLLRRVEGIGTSPDSGRVEDAGWRGRQESGPFPPSLGPGSLGRAIRRLAGVAAKGGGWFLGFFGGMPSDGGGSS